MKFFLECSNRSHIKLVALKRKHFPHGVLQALEYGFLRYHIKYNMLILFHPSHPPSLRPRCKSA